MENIFENLDGTRKVPFEEKLQKRKDEVRREGEILHAIMDLLEAFATDESQKADFQLMRLRDKTIKQVTALIEPVVLDRDERYSLEAKNDVIDFLEHIADDIESFTSEFNEKYGIEKM